LTAAAPVFVVGVYFSGYFWGGVCVWCKSFRLKPPIQLAFHLARGW
jgi:hypothetical protein